MQQLQQLHVIGEVTQEIFFAEDTNYRILRVNLSEEVEGYHPDDAITVTGNFPEIKLNHMYDFEGKFIEHAKYGHQFVASLASEILPKERDNIVHYVKNLDIPGVGAKTIERLFDFLGTDMLERIMQEGHGALVDFAATGWNEQKASGLVEAIQNEQALQLYYFKLIKYGFPTHVVSQLHEKYKDNLEIIIQTNCYQLLDDFDGFTIKTIDKIVLQHFPEQVKFRLKYAIVYYIKTICYRYGNSLVTFAQLMDAILQEQFSPTSEADVLAELATLLVDRKVYSLSDNRYQLDFFYQTEQTVALKLQQLTEQKLPYPYSESHLDTYIKTCEESFGIIYAVQQKAAMHEAFKHPVTLLTGGPGTGKTTIIKAILELYILHDKSKFTSDEQIHRKIALLAPTGRAAQRMTETTGIAAKTMHRFLGWDKHQNSYRFNADNPISEIEFLIIDESSMIDMWLLSALFKAIPNVRQIIFVGDMYQLPSVGPGQCFADMLQSNFTHTTFLTDIFRQKANSTIIDVSAQINIGKPSNVFFKNSEDYSFLAMQPQQLLHALGQICKNALTKGYTVEEIQVLTPLYKSAVGIDAINAHLQTVFNDFSYEEDEKFIGRNEAVFLPNDKVIQLKNLPDLDVYNGDIGQILSIEKLGANKFEVAIEFNGNIVLYSNEEMKLVAHAYCISIHKSQGSEFPVVIMPVFFQYKIMLYRQLMYTGTSRAKKALILLGQKDALLQAIQNNHQQQRLTNLRYLLSDDKLVEIPTTLLDALAKGITGEQLDNITPWSFL